MELEIPIELYALLLIEAAESGAAVEEIAESALRNYLERKKDGAEQ